MSLEAPPPLKSAPGVTPELARALRALRDGQMDQERIARVSQKLGPLLDAPAPASPYAPGLGHGLFKSMAAKLAASALVLAGTAAWLTQSETRSTTAQEAPVAPPFATPVEVAQGAPATALESAKPTPPAALEAPAPTTPSAPVEVATRAPGSPRIALKRKPPAPAPSAALPMAQVTPEPEIQAAEPASAPPEPAPEEPVRKEPAPAPLPSEVDLLFAARKQLRSEPSAALRLLDQAVARFPNGMLVPEREVLVIEALRKVGRSAEAEQRLARFKAQHPDSPHLPAMRWDLIKTAIKDLRNAQPDAAMGLQVFWGVLGP